MVKVRQSVEVEASIEDCYEAWSRFENFPEFMSNVRDVRMLGERESIWITRILGVRQEWRAALTRQDRPRALGWQATGDVGMSGEVTFTALEPRRTKVEVELEWRGDALKEGVAGGLGIDEMTVKQDLRNFKDFVEGRKVPRAGSPSR